MQGNIKRFWWLGCGHLWGDTLFFPPRCVKKVKGGHYGVYKGQKGNMKSYGEELYQQSCVDYGRDFIKTNGVTEFTLWKIAL